MPRQARPRYCSQDNMKLSLFPRLMIGYFVILLLATGVVGYAVVKLYMVKQDSHAILLDNYLLDLRKELSDALLSEIRYEKKFMILRDRSLRESFLKSAVSFDQLLGESGSFPVSDETKSILGRIRSLHDSYRKLCDMDALNQKGSQNNPWKLHDATKDKLVNALIDELNQLRTLSEDSIVRKTKKLGDVGTQALTMAVALTVVSFGLGIVLSVVITRSITKPLSVMRDKTEEIARGVFGANLDLPSPPEINALAQAFNSMCAKLKEVDRMKSDFFSLMSHELRTPLTSIKEGTNLFLEGKGGEITEKQERLLTIISEESNRLIELVNSLLDLSKLEAGIAAFHFASADLSPLITRAIREIEPLAEAKRIQIKRDIQPSPQITVDAERILQVLRNLIGNALKFTPSGGVIGISLRTIEDKVEVSVSDTGQGIPKEETEVIFDKFQQAVHAGSRKIQGTGLGLAIVKHIVQFHGGNIWVESTIGRGSTFRFTLWV